MSSSQDKGTESTSYNEVDSVPLACEDGAMQEFFTI